MTEQRACEIMEKTVINGSPHANTAEYIEALEISIDKLGVNYTREQLKNWILVNKYPFLMPTYWNFDTQQYEPDNEFDYTYTTLEFNDGVQEGWIKAFGEMLCEELKEELDKYDYTDKFRFGQVKQKYARSTIYPDDYPTGSKIPEILDKYAHLSENICFFCGKPDVPIVGTSYILPICKDCYCTPIKFYKEKMNSAELKEFHDEHEEKWNMWKNKRGEKMCNSYSVKKWTKDGGTEEVTYDISETANKIRAKWRTEHGE